MTDEEMSGKRLNVEWGVGAKHALYYKDGNWFHNLKEFPGALFDPYGYVLFETDGQYRDCPQLRVRDSTNITTAPEGICSIPGYVRVKEPIDPERPFPQSADHTRPKKRRCEVYRTLRDTKLSRRIKQIHRYRCQLCGSSIHLGGS